MNERERASNDDGVVDFEAVPQRSTSVLIRQSKSRNEGKKIMIKCKSLILCRIYCVLSSLIASALTNKSGVWIYPESQ